MIKHTSGNTAAIIIAHEIYGINDFISNICHQYHDEGYDVYCPDLINPGKVFRYSETAAAYNTFVDSDGFGTFQEINALAYGIRATYSKIILTGFSVGATVAWRCSEESIYDGIICCYGSRIRDYLTINPSCPVLLAFARYDTFDVMDVKNRLQAKRNTSVEIFEANHGFLDAFSDNYCRQEAERFERIKANFLFTCSAR